MKAARLGFSPFQPRFRIDVTERTPVTCEIRACFFPFPHTARQGVIRGESPWPPHPPPTSAHPNVTMSRRDNHRWRIMMKYCISLAVDLMLPVNHKHEPFPSISPSSLHYVLRTDYVCTVLYSIFMSRTVPRYTSTEYAGLYRQPHAQLPFP
jgi:hypothetical protein